MFWPSTGARRHDRRRRPDQTDAAEALADLRREGLHIVMFDGRQRDDGARQCRATRDR